MYEYLKGVLTEVELTRIVIDINGIGFKIFIPLNSISRLPEKKSTIQIYVCQIIREDMHALYGFLTKEEKEFFELLITVSGIGPKTALALLGHIDYQNLKTAIATSDTKLIGKAPGIGKKTAERVVVELKDKCKLFEKNSLGHPVSSVIFDAINALSNLGYNPLQAQKAVKSARDSFKEEPQLGHLITAALRHL